MNKAIVYLLPAKVRFSALFSPLFCHKSSMTWSIIRAPRKENPPNGCKWECEKGSFFVSLSKQLDLITFEFKRVLQRQQLSPFKGKNSEQICATLPSFCHLGYFGRHPFTLSCASPWVIFRESYPFTSMSHKFASSLHVRDSGKNYQPS